MRANQLRYSVSVDLSGEIRCLDGGCSGVKSGSTSGTNISTSFESPKEFSVGSGGSFVVVFICKDGDSDT